MKRLSIALFVIAVLGGGVAAARYAFHDLLERPIEPFPKGARFDVTTGQSFAAIAEGLEEKRLIPSAWALRLWARWSSVDRQIHQGMYRFDEPLSPLGILGKLRRGEGMLVRVTLPEGVTAADVARAMAEAGVGTEEEYRALYEDPELVRSLGVPADSLEGYLFPDTYLFSPLDPPQKVLRTLTAHFHRVFDDAMKKRAEEMNMTVHEVVTLASIIEKETGVDGERAMISSVFHNRLRLGMPLQADPTVIYGIEEFDGNLTRKHLETPTPYNTYANPGLPPGPIANPGRAALEAALHPAEGRYLYFVSRNDGSHEFTKSLREHNAAVNRFQRRRRSTGG